MYADAAKIRSHTIKLRMNEEEYRLVTALAEYTGEQKAVLLREIILEQAVALIQTDDSSNKIAV